MRRRRLAVVAALALAAVFAGLLWAHAGHGRAIEVGDTTVLVAERTDGAMNASFSGELALVAGCLGVGDAVVVWPNGTHVVGEDPLRVEVPGYGEYGVGDVIEAGGGHVSEPGDPDAPASLVVAGAPVPEECAARRVFLLAPED